MKYSEFDLDRAIWHCVPHLFEDGCGERLQYDHGSISGRVVALFKAGEALFFRADDLNVPEWVPKVLRAAYNDLSKGHFNFTEDADEYRLEDGDS